MTDLVERVARAIGKAMNKQNTFFEMYDASLGELIICDMDCNKFALAPLARAAIAAMREPSDAGGSTDA